VDMVHGEKSVIDLPNAGEKNHIPTWEGTQKGERLTGEQLVSKSDRKKKGTQWESLVIKRDAEGPSSAQQTCTRKEEGL